jgi:hypothetical protein
LETSDFGARVIHQETANEIVLVSEAVGRHIIGGEEEPRIFYCASAKHNDRCWERPPAPAGGGELYRLDSRA